MASYTITTTRTQEAGLKWSYDAYADKTQYPTQQAYLQAQVNIAVTDPMYVNKQRASTVSFGKSFETIPEANQPAAQAEIEASITSHGGTIVPATIVPAVPPAPPPAATAMLSIAAPPRAPMVD